MPRQIFKNRVIASAGPPPPSITLENLQTWIPMRKGRFVETFDDEVTHLLCTHEQFKKRVPLVRQVLKEHKRIHIVHYDWLEFSAVFNKRLPEREYSMRIILAKERAEQRERNRQENGRREGERGLWESNAKPHLYWFTAKFMRRKGDPNAAYHRPSPCSGKWRHEMNVFMNFFRVKTGIEWQDRVLLEGTTLLSTFQYCPPKGGKPVGRRLRFSYDCCVELNQEWKQQNLPQAGHHEAESGEDENAVQSAEDDNPDSDGNDDPGNCTMDLDEEFRDDDHCATQQIQLGDAPKSDSLSVNDSGISLEEGIAEAADDDPSERRLLVDES